MDRWPPADQEHRYWVLWAQQAKVAPDLNERVGYGQPASTPPLKEMWSAWRTVTKAADRYPDTLTPHKLQTYLERQGQRLNLELHSIEPLQPFTIGSYRVIAFPANHDPEVEPPLYAIEADGRSIFYGTDTATLSEETWWAFHQHKMRFDVVILDHTYGPSRAAIT